MFAIIAAIVFFWIAFGFPAGSINLLYLALAFLALHWGWTLGIPFMVRRNPQ